MRAFLIPVALAAIFTTAPAAFAGDSDVGQMTRTQTSTIKSVDHARGLFVLADGTMLAVPAGAQGARLKAGEKVRVTYDIRGLVRVLDNLRIVG